MGPKTTPSLISKGGYQIPPPSPGREGYRHPLGNRVKARDGHHAPVLWPRLLKPGTGTTGGGLCPLPGLSAPDHLT